MVSSLRHTLAMQPSVEQQSDVAEGTSLRIGSLVWPRAYFPSRAERAALVKSYLPHWAIATGQTAGFVFTGMGSPEPWTLLRQSVPAISPLERTSWPSSLVNPAHHRLLLIGGLWLTREADTVIETLLRPGCPTSAATQLLFLCDTPVEKLASATQTRRASAHSRHGAGIILQDLAQLRDDYPDITR